MIWAPLSHEHGCRLHSHARAHTGGLRLFLNIISQSDSYSTLLEPIIVQIFLGSFYNNSNSDLESCPQALLTFTWYNLKTFGMCALDGVYRDLDSEQSSAIWQNDEWSVFTELIMFRFSWHCWKCVKEITCLLLRLGFKVKLYLYGVSTLGWEVIFWFMLVLLIYTHDGGRILGTPLNIVQYNRG